MEVIDYHTALSEQVMETMLYFDIFHYPLKAKEVHTYLHTNGATPNEIKETLDRLAGSKMLFRFGDLYTLHADEENIKRRIRGNQEAEKWIGVARQQGRLMARFPFVRAVMASGARARR